MTQHRNQNQNRMKTSRTKTSVTKPLDGFSPTSLNSNPELASLNPSLSNMALNSSIPSELSQGQAMDLNQLLKNATSTSENSNEPEEKTKKPDRFQRLEDGFTDQFTNLGILLMAFSPADGTVVVTRANPLAARLADVARVNPVVYKALSRYLKESAYFNLAGELATIVLAILANHGVNPVGWLIDKAKGKPDGNSELSAVA